MACVEARERIASWLCGEIGANDRRSLEEHLRGCAACASDADRTRRALDLVAADDVPDPGPLYWSSFGDRLRARIAATRRRLRLLRLTAGIAAAVVVVAGLVLIEARRGGPPPRLAGGGTGGVHAAPRALSVEEAETRLREALARAAAEGQDAGEIETILDEIAPTDSLEGAGNAYGLSPAEDSRLSDDLLDPRG